MSNPEQATIDTEAVAERQRELQRQQDDKDAQKQQQSKRSGGGGSVQAGAREHPT